MKVHIIALHLAFGGIEKAIISMANCFAERYEVEIHCVYNMPDSPAFPLDPRVRVNYLLEETPNRREWKAALAAHRPLALLRESMKSIRILLGKRRAVIRAIRGVEDGVLITTRHEDNLLLSSYGRDQVLKLAQLHHDHRFEKKYIRGFRRGYRNIDYLAMLTPGLAEEAETLMAGYNSHTKVVYMPNFLEHYPARVELGQKEKLVLAVGRLNPVKRFDLLIRSFARVHDRMPDWKLRIVGEGEERPRLEALIRELDAEEYICLTGRKDSAGVEREMLSASLYAMTSQSEGFPFVLLEAQSCALPVLAYDVRVGPGFVIHHGEDGCLIPEGDISRFEDCLLGLAASPQQREAMARAAMAHAASFSRERVGARWFALLGE